METTSGSIAENKKLMGLIDQHQKNTRCTVRTVVADHKYGTNENYVACQARGLATHMGEATRNTANTGRKEGIFGDEAFTFDPVQNIYRCPAGQILKPRRVHAVRRTLEYKAPARVCTACAMRAQCTRSAYGRTVQRHEKQELLNVARAQANSIAAHRNRKRRQHLMERSFVDAANNHHFKRARWRRLWRQQIQDYLIAAIQNVRILLTHQNPMKNAAAAVAPVSFTQSLLYSLITALTGSRANSQRYQAFKLVSRPNNLLIKKPFHSSIQTLWATRPQTFNIRSFEGERHSFQNISRGTTDLSLIRLYDAKATNLSA